MKSLITFITESSAKQGKKVTTEEIRNSIDEQLRLLALQKEELEDLKQKTYEYDRMEKALHELKNEAELV
jgi:hypothetical protein